MSHIVATLSHIVVALFHFVAALSRPVAFLSRLSAGLSCSVVVLSSAVGSLLRRLSSRCDLHASRCLCRPVVGALMAAVILLLSACGPGKDRVCIKGHFRGVDQAELYLYDEFGAPALLDTIRLSGGRFEMERSLSGKRVVSLLFPNFTEMLFVIEPGKTIDIEADATNLAEMDVAGSEDNELLTKFRRDNRQRRPADLRLAATDFIRRRPETAAATALYITYFVKQPLRPDAAPLLETLLKAQPSSATLQSLRNGFLPVAKGAQGQSFPRFTAQDAEGRPVRLTDYAGRPVLIAFWSSWSGQSRLLLNELRKLHRVYADRLGIISVAVDYDRKQCERRVRTDTVPGRIIYADAAFDSPIVQQLGVRSVPGYILLDRSGRVVTREGTHTDLREQIARILSRN